MSDTPHVNLDLQLWVERLRFVKRVMENWSGATDEDRAEAYWVVRDLFTVMHAAAMEKKHD